MAIQTLYPNIEPSLNLSFALTKALDPRITFTRTTTAVFYNGVTTAKAEENLVLQSQAFETANWTKSDCTITANTSVAPDGTTTAETINEGVANAAHRIQSTAISFVSGNTYVFSFFAKNIDANFVQLVLPSGAFGGIFANFDISTGVVGTFDTATASIESVGNSWYRCIATATATGNSTQDFSIGLADSSSLGRLVAYTGTSRTAILWGAQVEQRSAVTAYTPTTTQPITNYIPVLLTAASGVARFDHNPVTGESLGLLVEEQRTNLVTYSDDFANAAWTKNNATITANTIVAPDGTLTGDKLVASNGASDHFIGQDSSSVSTGVAITESFYAKASECTEIRVRIGSAGAFSGAPQSVTFSLSGSGSGSVSQGTPSFSISAVGNGWYRCAITATTIATGIVTVRVSPSVSNNTSFDADGSGIFIWGAQLEEGAFPTSYIPTVAATVTRNADAASMTGTNFSSWFNNAEGSVYGEAQKNYSGSTAFPRIAQISGATNDNSMTILWADSLSRLYAAVSVSGSNVADIGNNNLTQTTVHKSAFAYKVNDFAISNDGLSVQTDTSGTVPTVDRIFIGKDSGTTYLNGTIRKLAFYPKRLANAELQALTS
jgi:hypothetical protein